jgi:glutamine---fructose-6-phosphate transaminase (isomerizing)
MLMAAVRATLPATLRGIVLVARGSSDHAAVYGRYVLEAACGLPVARAAPSLHTLYGAPAHYDGYLAVATSQSGRTPEIVTVLERMQQHGAAGVAVTNDAASPLALAADAVVELDAGEERAVPATKTFTAQVVLLYLLALRCGLRDEGGEGAVSYAQHQRRQVHRGPEGPQAQLF